MSEKCNELHLDTEDRCDLSAGHEGPHSATSVYGARVPFYSANQEKRELANSLRRAEIHALDLAKELRLASLAVSKL